MIFALTVGGWGGGHPRGNQHALPAARTRVSDDAPSRFSVFHSAVWNFFITFLMFRIIDCNWRVPHGLLDYLVVCSLCKSAPAVKLFESV